MDRKLIKTIEFDDDLAMEYSALSQLVPMGRYHNKMELYVDEEVTESDRRTGCIIWSYEKLDVPDDEWEEDETVIGLWFDGNKVTDYDGVMSISNRAIDLLKEAGFDTSDIEID